MKRLLKILGGMIPRPPLEALKILSEKAHVNLGDLESYPELKRAWRKAVSFASVYSLGKNYPGIITSGATESNILAAYLAREQGAKRIISFETAHYSISKAAKLLGMKHLVLPTLNGFEPDVQLLKKTLKEKDLVVVTLGNTFTGYLDPVEDIEIVAEEVNAVVHVDAAFAGPLLSFIDPKPLKELNKTIRTLALDIHKVPEAPIGVGVLLSHSDDYLERVWFTAPYIPSGKQVGILGTRAGAPLLAAEIILDKLIKDNNMKMLFDKLMNAAFKVYKELVEEGPYETPHEPKIPLVCLIHEKLENVLKNLERMGYKAYTCKPLFKGIRLAIMPHILDDIENIINVLKRAASAIK